MKQSNTRHNVFSKVDHDKAFIDVNYRDRKNESTKELPALRMDIRKKLASTHLSSKLSGKTPVITVATNLGEEENEIKYFDQFGSKDMVYDDDNASIASNLSRDLENQKKSSDQLKMNDFMDELGKVGIGSDVGEDEEESFDSDDSYGEFIVRDRKKYTSTLDVHRKFMLKARKLNTISDIKTVASMKIMSHKKKAMKTAQDQDILRPGTGGNIEVEHNSTPSKTTTNAIATSSSGGSLLGIASATKSFMFLSKISAGALKQPTTGGANADSPQTSATSSPALRKHKSVSIAPVGSILSSSSSPRDSPIPTPISSPSVYTASPGGYAYSSKHNLLQDSSNIGSGGSNSPLPLFGKAKKPKQIAHRAFSATTLSTLHSKFDTTNSVLSATRDNGAVVKVAAPIGEQLEVDGHMENKTKPLYHVPTLKSVHGKKTMLGYLDKLFNAVTYQSTESIPRPATPPPPEPLTVETLFKDQLLHANNKGRQISERELNTLLNSVQGPVNYGPRIVPDRTTPAAIVAELERQLEQQRREEQEEKKRYQNIAAAHVAIVDDTAADDRTPTDGYSMATFANRLEELNNPSTGLAANRAGKFNHNPPDGEGVSTPLKLDLSAIHNRPSPIKPSSKAAANKSSGPYSIDVHALKLPDIMSPNSDAYSQRQKQPILCIYSPAPIVPTASTTGSPGSIYSSPDAGKSVSPSSAAVSYHSPIQLQGTLTSTAGGHAASSPAIMYISSPGMGPSSSTASSALMSPDAHGHSTASLPMIISKTHSDSHGDSYQQRHHYQTHAEYLKSLHPQTREFVNSMLHNKIPDFHTDPRNYRGGSMVSGESVAGVDESIYDYDQEYEDMQLEPVGDRGTVDLHTESNRVNLPNSVAQQGGDALLSMGYQYQHSTGTYIHKEEQNRSKFGQYERAPLGDPYAGDFSDRHLEAITNTTVGTAPPVIFIPPGAPPSEPRLSQQPKTALTIENKAEGSVASRQMTHDPLHVNRIGKTALEAGEVMQGSSYAPVRTVMQHPHGVALSSIHYHSEGIANTNTTTNKLQSYKNEGLEDSDNDDYDSFKQYPVGESVISADNSTLQNSHSDGDIKQEICAYIEKLAAQNRAEHTMKQFNNNNPATRINNNTYRNNNSSTYSSTTNNSQNDYTSHQTHTTTTTTAAAIAAAEKARVKLWDKLNNRYKGDREGDFNKKTDIKEYIYKGIKEDTQILKSYMEDIDEGWVI